MNDIFARMDDALIDRVFQPFVDWVADRIAVNGFRIARICVDLSALAWILSQCGGIAGTAEKFALEASRFALIVVGLGAISFLRPLFGRSAGSPNPLRAAMSRHRAICLLWLAGLLARTAAAPIGLASMALLGVGVFATMAVYAGACSNHPSGRREVRMSDWRLRPAIAHRG